MFKIGVFDAKKYDIESFNKHKTKDIEFIYYEVRLTKDTVELVKGLDGVCVFVNDEINKEVIDRLSFYNVKLILLRCAGFNNVDLLACKDRDIKVFRVPAYSPYAIAEHAFSLLLASNRRIHKAYIRTKEYNFSLDGLVGMDLHNKTIGVIGTGKIGRIMCDIANGFKMNVIAYDPYPNKECNATYKSLDELIKESDIISLHCPLTKENVHLINKESINKMKKGVIIINTSRGALINARDLYKGLIDRKISAALLDVYEEEGPAFFNDKSNHILDDETLSLLISLPNVIVTSHQGFLTHEALENIAIITIENIYKYFNLEDNKENEVTI